jgi:hypothetical protein
MYARKILDMPRTAVLLSNFWLADVTGSTIHVHTSSHNFTHIPQKSGKKTKEVKGKKIIFMAVFF